MPTEIHFTYNNIIILLLPDEVYSTKQILRLKPDDDFAEFQTYQLKTHTLSMHCVTCL